MYPRASINLEIRDCPNSPGASHPSIPRKSRKLSRPNFYYQILTSSHHHALGQGIFPGEFPWFSYRCCPCAAGLGSLTMAANFAHHCMLPGGEDESRRGFIAHSDVHDSSSVVPVALRPRQPTSATSSVGADFAECLASRLEELCRIEQGCQPHSSWRCGSTRAGVGATPDCRGDLRAMVGQGHGPAWVGQAARMRVGEFAGSQSPTLTRASSGEETGQDDSGFVICRGRLTQSNSDESSCVSNDSISPRTPSEEFESTHCQDMQGEQSIKVPQRRLHI